MTDCEELTTLLRECTPQERRIVLAIMGLAVALKDADEWTRDWALETVTKLVHLEPPEDLSIWEAAIENWE